MLKFLETKSISIAVTFNHPYREITVHTFNKSLLIQF